MATSKGLFGQSVTESIAALQDAAADAERNGEHRMARHWLQLANDLAEVPRGLRLAELAVLDLLTQVVTAIQALPPCHASEGQEARYHVHALQLLIMSRAAVREYPERFIHEPDFK